MLDERELFWRNVGKYHGCMKGQVCSAKWDTTVHIGVGQSGTLAEYDPPVWKILK